MGHPSPVTAVDGQILQPLLYLGTAALDDQPAARMLGAFLAESLFASKNVKNFLQDVK